MSRVSCSLPSSACTRSRRGACGAVVKASFRSAEMSTCLPVRCIRCTAFAAASLRSRPGRNPNDSSSNRGSLKGWTICTMARCTTWSCQLATSIGRVPFPDDLGISIRRTGPGRYVPVPTSLESLLSSPRTHFWSVTTRRCSRWPLGPGALPPCLTRCCTAHHRLRVSAILSMQSRASLYRSFREERSHPEQSRS